MKVTGKKNNPFGEITLSSKWRDSKPKKSLWYSIAVTAMNSFRVPRMELKKPIKDRPPLKRKARKQENLLDSPNKEQDAKALTGLLGL